jgi:phthalate 4,5-dioxygenase
LARLAAIDPSLKERADVPASRLGFDYLPNTTDWYGRWRLTQNPSNDWMIDRAAQKSESFTGIASI